MTCVGFIASSEFGPASNSLRRVYIDVDTSHLAQRLEKAERDHNVTKVDLAQCQERLQEKTKEYTVLLENMRESDTTRLNVARSYGEYLARYEQSTEENRRLAQSYLELREAHKTLLEDLQSLQSRALQSMLSRLVRDGTTCFSMLISL